MSYIKYVITLLLFFCFTQTIAAEGKHITIIHSNDLHSHFMGFSPELDYTPDQVNDDETLGGWARIATVIKNEKKKRNNTVLVLDAGDFTMGSLFHMLAREKSFELRLLKKMGYDLVTLGNHEFDLMPKGLARILLSAEREKGLPDIVFSSALFSPVSAKDDELEAVFKRGLVKRYEVRVINGIKTGFFGILGNGAADDAPFASPVTFRKPVEIAGEVVKELREKEKVAMVVCLSHSGLYVGNTSEDEELAKKVPGIDVIISGHTHTRMEKPLIMNNTIIVQAGEYGKTLGVLDLVFENGKVAIKKYSLIDINDSIPADKSIQNEINGYIGKIDHQLLKPYGLSYWQTLAESEYDLPIVEDESTLGNLIADSIIWYVNKYDYDPADPDTKVMFAVESNGVIRDSLQKGKTGKISVADLFRTIPLGIGMDGSMGYPLISCYLYGSEIKKALEVLTSVYPLKGSDYFLQISGVKFTYNPYRVIFDRVTEIWIDDNNGYRKLDYSSDNKKLYRIAANIYDATFLKIIGKFTFNILKIIPKDRMGNPIDDLAKRRIDADKNIPGIQEVKEWVGVIEYVKSFQDNDGNGIPDFPEQYNGKQDRIVKKASFSPFSLLSRGTMITWVVFVIFCVLVLIMYLLIRFIIRKFRIRNFN